MAIKPPETAGQKSRFNVVFPLVFDSAFSGIQHQGPICPCISYTHVSMSKTQSDETSACFLHHHTISIPYSQKRHVHRAWQEDERMSLCAERWSSGCLQLIFQTPSAWHGLSTAHRQQPISEHSQRTPLASPTWLLLSWWMPPFGAQLSFCSRAGLHGYRTCPCLMSGSSAALEDCPVGWVSLPAAATCFLLAILRAEVPQGRSAGPCTSGSAPRRPGSRTGWSSTKCPRQDTQCETEVCP